MSQQSRTEDCYFTRTAVHVFSGMIPPSNIVPDASCSRFRLRSGCESVVDHGQWSSQLGRFVNLAKFLPRPATAERPTSVIRPENPEFSFHHFSGSEVLVLITTGFFSFVGGPPPRAGTE